MLDLSTWNLSVPTDPKPTEVSTQQIARGYKSRFFTHTSSQANFWVPVTGSHSSDSVFPRTELRETLPDGSLYNWYYKSADNELRATLAVEQVPSQNKVVIGQIHSRSPYSGDGEPLLKLQYHYIPSQGSGRIEALLRNHPQDETSVNVPILDGVTLGQSLTYSLRVTSSGNLGIRVRCADGREQYYQKTLSTTWSTQLLYFKAGAYIADNYGPTTEGARVVFYHLNLAHR